MARIGPTGAFVAKAAIVKQVPRQLKREPSEP